MATRESVRGFTVAELLEEHARFIIDRAKELRESTTAMGTDFMAAVFVFGEHGVAIIGVPAGDAEQRAAAAAHVRAVAKADRAWGILRVCDIVRWPTAPDALLAAGINPAHYENDPAGLAQAVRTRIKPTDALFVTFETYQGNWCAYYNYHQEENHVVWHEPEEMTLRPNDEFPSSVGGLLPPGEN